MGAIKLKHTSGNGTNLNSPAANPSSDITLKLPSTTGSAGQVLTVASANHSSTNAELEFAAAASGGGITIAQTFRRTSTTATNGASDYLTGTWEKSDGTAQGGLGSFDLPSSGIFTFPSTGFYLITFQTYFEDSTYSQVCQIKIDCTTDGAASGMSTVSAVNFGTQYDTSGYTYQSAFISTILDITDVTNQKVRFGVYSNNTVSWDGSNDEDRTAATFIRLGDT